MACSELREDDSQRRESCVWLARFKSRGARADPSEKRKTSLSREVTLDLRWKEVQTGFPDNLASASSHLGKRWSDKVFWVICAGQTRFFEVFYILLDMCKYNNRYTIARWKWRKWSQKPFLFCWTDSNRQTGSTLVSVLVLVLIQIDIIQGHHHKRLELWPHGRYPP